MARDYTKYQVEGIDGVFGKGKLVLAVVQDYCSKNDYRFDELKAAFPDEAQGGNTGVFGTLLEAQEIAKKRARHFVNDKIILKDAIIVVSNQWGDNLHLFIEQAEAIGYAIATVDGENENASETSTDVIKLKKRYFPNYDVKKSGRYLEIGYKTTPDYDSDDRFFVKIDMENNQVVPVRDDEYDEEWDDFCDYVWQKWFGFGSSDHPPLLQVEQQAIDAREISHYNEDFGITRNYDLYPTDISINDIRPINEGFGLDWVDEDDEGMDYDWDSISEEDAKATWHSITEPNDRAEKDLIELYIDLKKHVIEMDSEFSKFEANNFEWYYNEVKKRRQNE